MRSDSKHGGQYLRLAQGTQSFSRGLASELPPGTVSFVSPVRKIEQRDGMVRVTSARGVYEASRVVVSVPTPLYREITFDPALPPEKLELADATLLGDYCKSIVFYKTPWWREYDLCGLTQSCHGPYSVTRDSSVDADGHYSLTCFVVGQPAREWMQLSREDRDRAVLDQIQRLFGKFAEVGEPIEIVEQIWKAGRTTADGQQKHSADDLTERTVESRLSMPSHASWRCGEVRTRLKISIRACAFRRYRDSFRVERVHGRSSAFRRARSARGTSSHEQVEIVIIQIRNCNLCTAYDARGSRVSAQTTLNLITRSFQQSRHLKSLSLFPSIPSPVPSANSSTK